MSRAFVAGNHFAWFSSQYKDTKTIDLIEKDPRYLQWCIDNLKNLRFQDRIKRRLKKKIQSIESPEPSTIIY